MDDVQLKKLLGLRIKSFRKEKGMTQNQLCDMIWLEQNNLSKIENGKTFPDIKTLCTLIEKAGIEPNFLLGFLYKSDKKYTNLDYEIIEMLSKMPKKSKQHFKDFLSSLSE